MNIITHYPPEKEVVVQKEDEVRLSDVTEKSKIIIDIGTRVTCSWPTERYTEDGHVQV